MGHSLEKKEEEKGIRQQFTGDPPFPQPFIIPNILLPPLLPCHMDSPALMARVGPPSPDTGQWGLTNPVAGAEA